jgi:RimJ/RimL family protein N-acetyltransferase
MKKIELRALTSKDMETTVRWNNQTDVKFLYAGHPFPVNIEMEYEWYNKVLRSNVPTTVFGIELISEKKLIGISVLRNINLINRKAEFAILIGDTEERGKGYSKAATILTLKFGFDMLGLNKVYLFVQSSNNSAIKLYEKTGFKVEGIFRQSVFKNGKYEDEIIMSILKEEFVSDSI